MNFQTQATQPTVIAILNFAARNFYLFQKVFVTKRVVFGHMSELNDTVYHNDILGIFATV